MSGDFKKAKTTLAKLHLDLDLDAISRLANPSYLRVIGRVDQCARAVKNSLRVLK